MTVKSPPSSWNLEENIGGDRKTRKVNTHKNGYLILCSENVYKLFAIGFPSPASDVCSKCTLLK